MKNNPHRPYFWSARQGTLQTLVSYSSALALSVACLCTYCREVCAFFDGSAMSLSFCGPRILRLVQ